jgi:hypothetical protein
VRRAGPNGIWLCGIIGRVEGATQDGVCGLANDLLPLLPQRRPPGEPLTELGAEPPRALPDLDVLRQVLAGLRRLD